MERITILTPEGVAEQEAALEQKKVELQPEPPMWKSVIGAFLLLLVMAEILIFTLYVVNWVTDYITK